MTVKVFLTGVTGYIGGTAFQMLHDAHPHWEYTLLVRTEQRAEPVKARYPEVKFAYGTLENSQLLEKAAAEADMVVHTAQSADDVSSAKAIAKGMEEGHSASKPGYWIHVSGTGILCWYDIVNKRYGEAPLPEQKYADIDTVDRLVSLPDEAPHRNVDKIVQAAISDSVRVAIVAPPTIYGTGTGPVNTRSIQTPQLAAATLEKGFAPIVGAGKTEWDNIHVSDLGQLFVKLAEATQDPSKNGDPEVFGPKAYYFVEKGHHAWSEVSRWVAEEASRQGYLPEPLTKNVTMTEIGNLGGEYFAGITWATNSKGVAQRAAKYLGWEARAPSYDSTIAETVTREAQRLGMKAHEAKA